MKSELFPTSKWCGNVNPPNWLQQSIAVANREGTAAWKRAENTGPPPCHDLECGGSAECPEITLALSFITASLLRVRTTFSKKALKHFLLTSSYLPSKRRTTCQLWLGKWWKRMLTGKGGGQLAGLYLNMSSDSAAQRTARSNAHNKAAEHLLGGGAQCSQQEQMIGVCQGTQPRTRLISTSFFFWRWEVGGKIAAGASPSRGGDALRSH